MAPVAVISSDNRRVLLAILVSPAVMPAAVGGYALLKGWEVGQSVAIAAVYAAFTYGGTVALGLPTHALLTRFGLQSVWYYAAAGGLLGLVILAGFFLVDPSISVGMVSVLVFVTFGAVTAAVFWRLARSRTS